MPLTSHHKMTEIFDSLVHTLPLTSHQQTREVSAKLLNANHVLVTLRVAVILSLSSHINTTSARESLCAMQLHTLHWLMVSAHEAKLNTNSTFFLVKINSRGVTAHHLAHDILHVISARCGTLDLYTAVSCPHNMQVGDSSLCSGDSN